MGEETALEKASDKLVMVIDDDESARDLIAFAVKKEGFKTAIAADGEEGISQIESLRPDLVILDLMLPRYGGFEILRQLQGGDNSRIPIVIVTGRYTDRATAEMMRQESNVADFFEKPVKLPVLAMALHRILKTLPPETAGKGAQGP